MTREKIIQGLYKGDSRAIKEAIKALEQEPCEDAISKASVFEILGNLMSIPYDFDRQINEKDVSESMDEIKELPSVTPARKKAKWIDADATILNRQGYLVHEVICSECNGISYFRSMGNKYIGANYCPNCGTKMEK